MDGKPKRGNKAALFFLGPAVRLWMENISCAFRVTCLLNWGHNPGVLVRHCKKEPHRGTKKLFCEPGLK